MSTTDNAFDFTAARRKFNRLATRAETNFAKAKIDAEKAYDEAIKPHAATYEKAIASFKAEFDRATKEHADIYKQALADAEREFKAAIEAAHKESNYGA